MATQSVTWAEGAVIIGDWDKGDASAPTKIGMTLTHVGDGSEDLNTGHLNLNQWPHG